MSGDEGEDLLIGGLGSDKLFGGPRTTSLSGDAGNDESVWASSASDLLSGGRGDDLLSGGGGSDTFRFSRGDGHDTIRTDQTEVAATATESDWQTVWTTGSGWAENFDAYLLNEPTMGGGFQFATVNGQRTLRRYIGAEAQFVGACRGHGRVRPRHRHPGRRVQPLGRRPHSRRLAGK